MHANFTEEACTGTGDTLALAGVTAYVRDAVTIDSLPFAASFVDGALVAYVLEDSAGVIKVAGIGTYIAATDDITRNDTWSWNGTVVDDNPSTNITLSGGTHVIRCEVTGENLSNRAEFPLTLHATDSLPIPDNFISFDKTARDTGTADKTIFCPIFYESPFTVNALFVEVVTASATDVVQIGLVRQGLDGRPSEVIEIVTVDVTVVGSIITSLSQSYRLPAGRYFTVIAQSDLTAKFWTVEHHTHGGRGGLFSFGSQGNTALAKSSGAVGGIITTPLLEPVQVVNQINNIMVLPRFV